MCFVAISSNDDRDTCGKMVAEFCKRQAGILHNEPLHQLYVVVINKRPGLATMPLTLDYLRRINCTNCLLMTPNQKTLCKGGRKNKLTREKIREDI
ncbi:hypothetical protein AVEN_185006-1 [Araneus ventricosus]|uniref:Uncharacterized protein n=1 Tax=Araneus ventricosus TaxID=182803 RepID=A0A4Y2BQV0_ARAVE|nr:hypothetical protein AVEN_185006-1 [Araneus ventricosus]